MTYYSQSFRAGTLLQQVKTDLDAYFRQECSEIRRELDDCRVFWESQADSYRNTVIAAPAPPKDPAQVPTGEPPIVRMTTAEIYHKAQELGAGFGQWAEKQILAAQAREDQAA